MMKVLRSAEENHEAREVLRRRGLNFAAPGLIRSYLKKAGILNAIKVGDPIKSWDVLQTVQLLEKELPRESPILDLGTYASEVICILHRMGYRHLAGIDLNPAISQMPYHKAIRYIEGNFLESPFPAQAFRAVTAISVIEHGFRGEALLKELSRLIAPGGYFIASVDYWPEKIDTTGMQAFGLDWTIFSENDMRQFFELAGTYGFRPVGDIDYRSGDTLVHWNNKSYTFAWFVLRKCM